MTRIIGIDPGSRRTGYGVIDIAGSKISYVTSGIVRLPEAGLPERLKIIFDGISQIIQQYQPEHMAIEEVFMSQNAGSALKLGQARGAAIVAGVNGGLPVGEYSARSIKQSVVGTGAADKSQVQMMIVQLLKLSESPAEDAADALAVAICHAHTCTSLGYFTAQIAQAGLIGLGLTNASPIVAPPGGKSRVIGTNPIAFAVPDGQGGIAMQFDQSTTTVALGKITMAKAAGERIPEGWAIDADGAPTTDPEAALAGSLVSMGGYKGWGFGLMAELLAAGMTGGTVSRNVKPLKAPTGAPHDLGQYYLLIDPDVSGAFFDRMALVAEGVALDPDARMPGQNTRPAEYVDVPDSLWEMVCKLAQ